MSVNKSVQYVHSGLEHALLLNLLAQLAAQAWLGRKKTLTHGTNLLRMLGVKSTICGLTSMSINPLHSEGMFSGQVNQSLGGATKGAMDPQYEWMYTL